MKQRVFFKKAAIPWGWGRCIAYVVLLCCLVLICAGDARAQTAITTIDAPGAGTNGSFSQGTYATSINASGVITGYYYDSTFGSTLFGGCHGFIRTPDGTFITFDSPMTPASQPPSVATCPQPSSISRTGEVAGWYNDPSFGCGASWPDTSGGCGGQHGFLRMPNGSFITFDAPRELQDRYDPNNTNPGTFPLSIAGTGEVTGIYASCGQGSCNNSFLRTPDGTFVSFDPPNANPFYGNVGAKSVNGQGAIVGNFADSSSGISYGFLRAPDRMFTVLNPPGAVGGSDAFSINSSRTVLGNFSDVNNVGHGYLRAADGTFTVFDLSIPGACSAVALLLNNQGTILGEYSTLTSGFCYGNVVHFFLRASDGTFTTFDVPGATSFLSTFISGQVLAMNSSNAVVGTYFDSNGVAHGFLRPGTDPPPPDKAATEDAQN